MANPLHMYRILLADSDRELGRVVRDMLGKMGFKNVESVTSGKQALEMVQTEPFDFLITEWNLQHLDGLSLIKHIRQDPDSPRPNLPIIMLTGHAEQADVMSARDVGINEYVVKPFSAKAIYNRVERLIEQPREFVISKNFIGPNRRHKGTPPPGVSERRASRAKPQLAPKILTGKTVADDEPKIWLPDFSLKMKLGSNISLQSLITPEVLNQSQAAIDSITNDSLGWIKNDLTELKLLYQSMIGGTAATSLPQDMATSALSINSRAGTFGYTRAAQIAYMLYLFCRNRLEPSNKQHYLVIQKHIDVLQVILGNQLRGDAGAMGAQIVSELAVLVGKYGSH